MELTLLAGTDARRIFQYARDAMDTARERGHEVSEIDVEETPELVMETLAARSLFVSRRCIVLKNLFQNEEIADAVYTWWKGEKKNEDQLIVVEVYTKKAPEHAMFAYAKKHKLLTMYDITANEAVARNEIYHFVDTWLAGHVNQIVKEYASLTRRGVETPELFWALQYQVRAIAMALEGARTGATEAEIAERTSLHPFVISKSLRAAKTLPAGFITRTLARMREIDLNIKTTSSKFDDVFLQFLLTQ